MGLLPAILLAAQVIGPPAPPSTPDGEVRVPMIGLEGPAADACGGIARIATYDEKEPVHARPDPQSPESESLPHKTLVWLCEAEGEWQGIVYPSGEFQELGDCRVSSPVPQSRSYDGPCRHGWVIAENLELVVG